ncbi:hypothetical protein, partial [Vallitalea sediminicola]
LEFKRLLEKFGSSIGNIDENNSLSVIHHSISTKDELDKFIVKISNEKTLAYYIVTENHKVIGISITYNEQESYF